MRASVKNTYFINQFIHRFIYRGISKDLVLKMRINIESEFF